MRTLLPGFGRPLNYNPVVTDSDYVGRLFKNALSNRDIYKHEAAQVALTLRELGMLHFMNSITDKPDWFNKVNNEEIANKWKDEACTNSELDFTPQMANCCIDELRHLASIYSASPGNYPPIFVYNGDVIKSDTAVSPKFKHALQEEVKRFEGTILKDWHPGSDERVLDLVHPSLFPLVYGKTRILHEGEITTLANCIERCCEGETVPLPSGEEIYEALLPGEEYYESYYGSEISIFSQNFQWLPCEVDISGEHAKIKSYINNLHPHKEKRLYELMEKLIDASIPLWNVTLAPLADESFQRRQRITYNEVRYDPDPESWLEYEQPKLQPDESVYDWIKATRRLVFPEPNDFEPLPQPAPFDLKSKYGKRGLQVIVKLASIHLTPERPEYEGGTWHVEGQMNERIVSTALYYYSTENITTSTLSFRQLCKDFSREMIHYPQSDSEWLKDIFGCGYWEGTVQNIGSVETHEGRLLTFPNILQHRVEPFKLSDPTKPGHRKIVALFLVDPNIKITSTAHVPCQQQEWWWEAVMTTRVQSPAKATVNELPIELQDGILEGVDFPFSLEEAKILRLKLMEERKDFVLRHGDTFENKVVFSFCEH